MRAKQIIIIGAGFGGLSAAAILAKQGHRVTVLEKNDRPGGRGMVWEKDGFVFDMGPSWYTMPDAFEHYFSLFGKKPNDFYKLVRLDPSYRMFFGKDDIIDVEADKQKVLAMFDRLEDSGAEKLKRFLQQAEYQYNVSMESFLYKEYRTIFDMFNWRMITEGTKLHLFESMDTFTKRFFTNDRLRKILQYTLVFLGGAPKQTPALYALMAHIDINLGVWYPMGGLGAVVDAFVTLGKEYGVTYKYSHEVEKILVENGKAVGIQTKDKEYRADIVVVNADYAHAELDLLPKQYQSYPKAYWEKKTMAPSAFIVYLGLKKQIKQLTHHNLFVHNDWVEHFDSMFKHPAWPENPSYYLSCPSKTDPSVAPKGKENIFILVPIAAGIQDTPEIREHYKQKIYTDLEGVLGTDIRPLIEVERVLSINDYTSLYHAYKGSALGLSHTLFQTAIFRPLQRSKKVKKLFFTGQLTHPGIGVPITLISSEIVAQMIRNERE